MLRATFSGISAAQISQQRCSTGFSAKVHVGHVQYFIGAGISSLIGVGLGFDFWRDGDGAGRLAGRGRTRRLLLRGGGGSRGFGGSEPAACSILEESAAVGGT